MRAEQGDLLKVYGLKYPVIVVSNNLFNETGKSIVCPIQKNALEGPLHIPLATQQVEGYILCEQVRYVDLMQRSYSKIGEVSYFDLMDVSDAVMGMFDYQKR